MGYSILLEPWVRVRLSDGSVRYVAPYQVAAPDIAAIDMPRPDMGGAAREVLIGLLQVLYAPTTRSEHRSRLRNPPSADEMKSLFEEHAARFELIEGRSRFFQEHGGIETAETRPLDCLPLNGPGDQTTKLHKDVFVRKGTITRICPDCVVPLLASRQIYASAAGAGFRVSPRGGGPLTTLFELSNGTDSPLPLWGSLYSNVQSEYQFAAEPLDDENAHLILPWLAPLRVSKDGKADLVTGREHGHRGQVFFPAAARIEIVWNENDVPCVCDVCGRSSNRYAVSWKTVPYGVKYYGFFHPLTPYRKTDVGDLISMKPKSGGVSYPDWLALVSEFVDGDDGVSGAAETIRKNRDMVTELGHSVLIRAYGYQLDKASALAWHESLVPFVDVPEHFRESFSAQVKLVAGFSKRVSTALVFHIKAGLYKRPSDVKGDMTHIQREFITDTSIAFYDSLPKIRNAVNNEASAAEELEKIKTEWLKIIHKNALRIFEKFAPIYAAEERNLQRLVNAYRKLDRLLMSDWARKELCLPVAAKVSKEKAADRKRNQNKKNVGNVLSSVLQ